jgi:hypothetical protein
MTQFLLLPDPLPPHPRLPSNPNPPPPHPNPQPREIQYFMTFLNYFQGWSLTKKKMMRTMELEEASLHETNNEDYLRFELKFFTV